jgi:hypothetical protein
MERTKKKIDMDYEKKYNEALKLATFYHGNCPSEPERKKLEKMFPELKESEDERIRRTLVEYFGPMAQLDLVRGVPIQKIRDWLEKQKEQPQVDLEKELDRYLRGEFQQTAGGNFNNYIQVARHFYELGKNSK